MTKYDPQKAQPVVLAVQKELEQEMAESFRQSQIRRAERMFFAGYQQAERDYKVGPHAPKTGVE